MEHKKIRINLLNLASVLLEYLSDPDDLRMNKNHELIEACTVSLCSIYNFALKMGWTEITEEIRRFHPVDTFSAAAEKADAKNEKYKAMLQKRIE